MVKLDQSIGAQSLTDKLDDARFFSLQKGERAETWPADWIIDLGPKGVDKGGEVIATETPEQIAEIEESHTGVFLKPHLERLW